MTCLVQRLKSTVKAFLALALVLGAARTVSAQPGWTSVGSAGTVDEADAAVVSFSLSDVTVRGTAPETVVMRYNVVPVPGVVGGNSLIFTARYRDTGPETRVFLAFRAKNINTGGVATLATLDSDAFPQSVNPQTRSVLACSRILDFENNAYFVEATLIRSVAGGVIALSNLKLDTGFFCEG
jgi:hypothetical protein